MLTCVCVCVLLQYIVVHISNIDLCEHIKTQIESFGHSVDFRLSIAKLPLGLGSWYRYVRAKVCVYVCVCF